MKRSIIITGTNDQYLSSFLSSEGITRTFVSDLEKAKKIAKVIGRPGDTIFIISSKVFKDDMANILYKKEGIHFINEGKVIIIEDVDNIEELFKQYKTATPPALEVVKKAEVIETEPLKIDSNEEQVVQQVKIEENIPIVKKPKKSKKKMYNEVVLNQESENDSKATSNDGLVV